MEKLVKYYGRKGKLSKQINCAEKIPYAVVTPKLKKNDKKTRESRRKNGINESEKTHKKLIETNRDRELS